MISGPIVGQNFVLEMFLQWTALRSLRKEEDLPEEDEDRPAPHHWREIRWPDHHHHRHHHLHQLLALVTQPDTEQDEEEDFFDKESEIAMKWEEKIFY